MALGDQLFNVGHVHPNLGILDMGKKEELILFSLRLPPSFLAASPLAFTCALEL